MAVAKRALSILVLAGALAAAGTARDRFVNITNPIILTRESCIAPYLAAMKVGGKDGADVIAALEHNGCIRRLTGIYEVENTSPDQKDPNFIHGTLRLNLPEMQRRDPQYQDKDMTDTPPVATGYAFRSQAARK